MVGAASLHVWELPGESNNPSGPNEILSPRASAMPPRWRLPLRGALWVCSGHLWRDWTSRHCRGTTFPMSPLSPAGRAIVSHHILAMSTLWPWGHLKPLSHSFHSIHWGPTLHQVGKALRCHGDKVDKPLFSWSWCSGGETAMRHVSSSGSEKYWADYDSGWHVEWWLLWATWVSGAQGEPLEGEDVWITSGIREGKPSSGWSRPEETWNCWLSLLTSPDLGVRQSPPNTPLLLVFSALINLTISTVVAMSLNGAGIAQT